MDWKCTQVTLGTRCFWLRNGRSMVQRFYPRDLPLTFHHFCLHSLVLSFGNRRCQRVEYPKSLNSVPIQCSVPFMCPRQGGEGKCMLFTTTKPHVDATNLYRPCGECVLPAVAAGPGPRPEQAEWAFPPGPHLALPGGGNRHSCLERASHGLGVEEAGARSLPFSSSTGHPGSEGVRGLQCGAEGGGRRQVRTGRVSLGRTASKTQPLLSFCKYCFYW